MSGTLVIGIGGAGMAIAGELSRLLDVRFLAIDIDKRSLEDSGATDRLLLGHSPRNHDGAGPASFGRQATEAASERIAARLKHHGSIVVVAGLGGRVGSGAASVVTMLAQSLGKEVLSAVVLPFGFEGSRREVALDAVDRLKGIGAELFVFDNESTDLRRFLHDTSLAQVLAEVNAGMADDLRARLATLGRDRPCERQVTLDVETTGLNPDCERIIEIACVELKDGHVTGRMFHHLLNPEKTIDPGALAVIELDPSLLDDKPKFGDVADELLDFISDAGLIIHMAPFDLGFLNRELARLGRPETIEQNHHVTDTLALARTLLPDQPHSLDALCKHYGISDSSYYYERSLLDAHLLADLYPLLKDALQAQELAQAQKKS